MSKEFLSAPISYKPAEHPESPYMRAKQEWDDRIGSCVVQAKNWRLTCLAALSLNLLLGSGLIIQAQQRKVIPVVVGIDKERGEPVVIGPVTSTSYQPRLQELKYFLSQFITLVRSVPQDSVLIKQNWLKAYAFLRRDAANVLNDITNNDTDSPLKKIGDQTVIVRVLSVVQVADGNSFQVRWEEVLFNRQGNQIQRYVMNGVFTTEIQQPTDEKELTLNPLGLFITNFQWNREL